MSIAENLKKVRMQLGMTQAFLAKLSGYTQSTISNIEKAQHQPTLTTVIALARALGVSIAVLDERLCNVENTSRAAEKKPLPDSLKRILDDRWDSLSPDQKVRIIQVVDEDPRCHKN